MLRKLTRSEVDRVQGMLWDRFGSEFEGDFALFSKAEKDGEKVFLYSGASVPEIASEWIGLHVGNVTSAGFCPTIEGAQLIGGRAKKAVASVSRIDAKVLMSGGEVGAPAGLEGCVLLEYGGRVFGAGVAEDGMITQSVPASRRLHRIDD